MSAAALSDAGPLPGPGSPGNPYHWHPRSSTSELKCPSRSRRWSRVWDSLIGRPVAKAVRSTCCWPWRCGMQRRRKRWASKPNAAPHGAASVTTWLERESNPRHADFQSRVARSWFVPFGSQQSLTSTRVRSMSLRSPPESFLVSRAPVPETAPHLPSIRTATGRAAPSNLTDHFDWADGRVGLPVQRRPARDVAA